MLTYRHLITRQAVKQRLAEDPSFDPDAPVPIHLEISDEPVSELEEQRFLAVIERCWEVVALSTTEKLAETISEKSNEAKPSEKKKQSTPWIGHRIV